MIVGWPSRRDEVHSDLKPYWCDRDDVVVIDGVVMNGMWIITPTDLKQQVLDQLHKSYGIEKNTATHM